MNNNSLRDNGKVSRWAVVQHVPESRSGRRQIRSCRMSGTVPASILSGDGERAPPGNVQAHLAQLITRKITEFIRGEVAAAKEKASDIFLLGPNCYLRPISCRAVS
ncbi:hypothetical protein GWI33_020415 [Rhynchophorus ferrugineus]|uniref:Uncharacterized protein n=1 Tax=Rhynchophorus ferrugineus TaxID=354439 RepID=A0A834HWG6_RHYFE|nr:hypothetical protein GWI33_020415 [Rhynchophorus ferrugineus]